MANTASIISVAIAVASAIVAFATLVQLFIKVKNSENITIKKSNGDAITISKHYNREQSKKLLEFMK